MENTKIDRRVRKTKALLLKGLTQLMEEKDVNHISVRELTDLVDLNRGTFYLHYRDIFDMVNQVRAENGLAALAWDDGLAALARAHSEDMIKRGFFDHVNPDGLGPDGRADAAGISYYMISENISAGDAAPEVIMDGWMNSPGHQFNILDPEATRLGVGVALGGELGVYWTQCFAG